MKLSKIHFRSCSINTQLYLVVNSYNLIYSTAIYFHNSVSCKVERKPSKINIKKSIRWQQININSLYFVLGSSNQFCYQKSGGQNYPVKHLLITSGLCILLLLNWASSGICHQNLLVDSTQIKKINHYSFQVTIPYVFLESIFLIAIIKTRIKVSCKTNLKNLNLRTSSWGKEVDYSSSPFHFYLPAISTLENSITAST